MLKTEGSGQCRQFNPLVKCFIDTNQCSISWFFSTRNEAWEAEELHSLAGVFMWMDKRGYLTRNDGMVYLKWKFGGFQPWILGETS